MDSESIAAALMHDVAEDTPVTVAEIKQKFGPRLRCSLTASPS